MALREREDASVAIWTVKEVSRQECRAYYRCSNSKSHRAHSVCKKLDCLDRGLAHRTPHRVKIYDVKGAP